MPFLKETKVKLVDFSSHSVRFTGHSHKSDYEMILGLEGRSYMTPLKEKLSLVSGGFGQLEDEFYFTWTMGLLERIIMNQSWTHSLTVPADGGFEMKMRRLMADLIGDNPSERLSSEELAAAIGFERTYLTRKIKQYTGKSLMELYYEELFDQARAMLAGGASVKEGAYHFGFANPYHFSRKFKQVTGELPSQVTC